MLFLSSLKRDSILKRLISHICNTLPDVDPLELKITYDCQIGMASAEYLANNEHSFYFNVHHFPAQCGAVIISSLGNTDMSDLAPRVAIEIAKFLKYNTIVISNIVDEFNSIPWKRVGFQAACENYNSHSGNYIEIMTYTIDVGGDK